MNMETNFHTVEEVCEKLNVTPRTLHYYEEVGLFEPVKRTSGGHRLYDDRCVTRLEHILKLKNLLGFSLKEIREIVEMQDRLEELKLAFHAETEDQGKRIILQECTELLEEVLAQIHEKMNKLATLKDHFQQKLQRSHQLLNELGDS